MQPAAATTPAAVIQRAPTRGKSRLSSTQDLSASRRNPVPPVLLQDAGAGAGAAAPFPAVPFGPSWGSAAAAGGDPAEGPAAGDAASPSDAEPEVAVDGWAELLLETFVAASPAADGVAGASSGLGAESAPAPELALGLALAPELVLAPALLLAPPSALALESA